MLSDLVIGVDSSTSGCKAAVWDAAGRQVTLARRPHRLLEPQTGWYEQEAPDWWEALRDVLQEITAQINPRRLAGICIAHQRETFVPVDRQGRPLRNAILWMDERARGLLPELTAACGDQNFQKITGKPLSGNLTYSKIAWLRRYEPEVFASTFAFLDVQAYLVQQLTGQARTSWGSADPTGLFDMRLGHWADELLTHIGTTAEHLPQVFPTGAVLGQITAAAAGQTGLPEGLPVIAGIGDGQAGGLAAGIITPGSAYLSLGSSVIGGTYSPEFITSGAFRTMCGGVPGSFLLETVILGGAYTIDWLLQKICPGNRQEELENIAANLPPGSEGLVVVPYWNSAMNPYWDAKASGIIVGWRGSHSPAHIYRAILEGIAMEFRLQLEGVQAALGKPVERLVLMGGGAGSQLWRAIIADATGRIVQRCKVAEAAALGAGILAAGSAGLHPDIVTAVGGMVHLEEQPRQPDPPRQAHYSRLYEEVYRGLFPALQQPLQRLSNLSESIPPD